MAKKIQLKNVRLSFPSLFKRASFDGKDGKFEATFLLDKEGHAKLISQIESEIEAEITAAKVKVPAAKRCLQDGDEKEYDGYAGMMSFKAANNSRPLIIDRDKSVLAEDDGKPYAGCYVNAIVELWVQNNNYGKRVNANLHAVQFVKDGEAFSSAPPAESFMSDFDDLGDDEDGDF